MERSNTVGGWSPAVSVLPHRQPWSGDLGEEQFANMRLSPFDNNARIGSSDYYRRNPHSVPKLLVHSHRPLRNYILQNYLGTLSREQLLGIIQVVKSDLIEMSLHDRRYRLVLELLNHATEPSVQRTIMDGLLPGVDMLMRSSRGAQIISQCIEKFPDEINKVLYFEIARRICIIAKDQVGYLQIIGLLQNFRGGYDHCILEKILENALTLAEDQYGNFVIQKVMDLNDSFVITGVLIRLNGYFSRLSFSRYGSHVVEKCLNIPHEGQCKAVVLELLLDSDISKLLSDSYGNFVIQRVWEVSKHWECIHEELARLIQQHASELRHNIYGRNVLGKLKDCWRRCCLHVKNSSY